MRELLLDGLTKLLLHLVFQRSSLTNFWLRCPRFLFHH